MAPENVSAMQDACERFVTQGWYTRPTTIHGLSYIGFRTGNRDASFEKIRQVLEREHLL